MDSRKWIEFGKMVKKIVESGWEFNVESTITEQGTLYCAALYSDYEIKDDELYYTSPYEAIKAVYFRDILGIETVTISLDLEEWVLDELYKQSDEADITFDEHVGNILKHHIMENDTKIPIELAKCCFNCYAFEKNVTGYGHCAVHQKEVMNQNTCAEFS